ncbi:MAG: hypothetical protein OXC07_03345 [Kistimonas sp.]|nr:hypothetical protein [Kistimonas sp.]
MDGKILFFRFDAPPGAEPKWNHVKEISPFWGGGFIARIPPETGYSVALAFSPDGQLLAMPSCNSCQSLRVMPISGPMAWQQWSLLDCGVCASGPDAQ